MSAAPIVQQVLKEGRIAGCAIITQRTDSQLTVDRCGLEIDDASALELLARAQKRVLHHDVLNLLGKQCPQIILLAALANGVCRCLDDSETQKLLRAMCF